MLAATPAGVGELVGAVHAAVPTGGVSVGDAAALRYQAPPGDEGLDGEHQEDQQEVGHQDRGEDSG